MKPPVLWKYGVWLVVSSLLLCVVPWLCFRAASLFSLRQVAVGVWEGTTAGWLECMLYRIDSVHDGDVAGYGRSMFAQPMFRSLERWLTPHVLSHTVVVVVGSVMVSTFGGRLLDQLIRRSANQGVLYGAMKQWDVEVSLSNRLRRLNQLAMPLLFFATCVLIFDEWRDGLRSVYSTRTWVVNGMIAWSLAVSSAWLLTLWLGVRDVKRLSAAESGIGDSSCSNCGYPTVLAISPVCPECGVNPNAWEAIRWPRVEVTRAICAVSVVTLLVVASRSITVGTPVTPGPSWWGELSTSIVGLARPMEYRIRVLADQGARVEWSDGTAIEFITCRAVRTRVDGTLDAGQSVVASAWRWRSRAGVDLGVETGFQETFMPIYDRTDAAFDNGSGKSIWIWIQGVFKGIRSVTNEAVATPGDVVSIRRIRLSRSASQTTLPNRAEAAEQLRLDELWRAIAEAARERGLVAVELTSSGNVVPIAY